MNEILFFKKTLRSVCKFSGKMWTWLSFLSSHNIEVGENISPKLGNFSFDSINYFHEILDESEVWPLKLYPILFNLAWDSEFYSDFLDDNNLTVTNFDKFVAVFWIWHKLDLTVLVSSFDGSTIAYEHVTKLGLGFLSTLELNALVNWLLCFCTYDQSFKWAWTCWNSGVRPTILNELNESESEMLEVSGSSK